MTINSRYSIKTLDNEQQNQLRSCSGSYLSGMYTVKQSSSLQDVSSCCVNKAISPNQSVETPLKSPPCSPKATITFEEQSKNTSPIRTPSENKMPCCAHYEAMMQSRSFADVTTDTGTHPIPDTGEAEMLMSDVKDSGVDDAASRPSMPGVDSKCCCPHLSNDTRGSSLRTTFNLPDVDTDEPSHKVPPVTCSCPKEDVTDKKDETKNVSSLTCSCPKVDIITDKKEDETKNISCSYPESKKTKITKKCDCHFPPAFNKFCCTGNISGNCNCENED
ncbi:hypothetical protein ABMA28_012945 [Loxostege sticticalis]|uniref:Uncharacterized protein n=1 Tax=Loxostege sticticalis TaxID=481309 RepID=A0ABD0S347_LOXSC